MFTLWYYHILNVSDIPQVRNLAVCRTGMGIHVILSSNCFYWLCRTLLNFEDEIVITMTNVYGNGRGCQLHSGAGERDDDTVLHKAIMRTVH
jgi:hypothetical protein